MNNDTLSNQHSDEISALLAVAKEGSFVAAGAYLNKHPSIISKRIASMEARLGIRLLERTTRKINITQLGQELVIKLQNAVELIREAQLEASDKSFEIKGTLRIALPATMGRMWIAPLIPNFITSYPNVSIVTEYNDDIVDVIGNGFDMAIRIGQLKDDRLIAKKICNHKRILCASPDYIINNGLPETPQDLLKHKCLALNNLKSFPYWKLNKENECQVITPKTIMISNDGESLLHASKSGLGIIGAGEWLLNNSIENGDLIHVLPEWNLDAVSGVYLIRSSSKYQTTIVKIFKEWIESLFSPTPPWFINK